MNNLFKTFVNELPDFMIGNIMELLGVLFASVIVAIFTTLIIDKKREVEKVKARVLDLRLEQYDKIRSFVEDQSKIAILLENCDDIKNNLEITGLFLEDNEYCYSSQAIGTERKIKEVLAQLENLTLKGLYVLDDDVLGMLLQIKIYVMNLNMFSTILCGYYDDNKDREEIQIATIEDINQISQLYFHHISVLLNNEYQDMIGKLQRMVIRKASKPKFERKEKDYRKIKTRKRLQSEALDKTILKSKFIQLIHVLASLCSAHFGDSEEQYKNTLKEFLTYTMDIVGW